MCVWRCELSVCSVSCFLVPGWTGFGRRTLASTSLSNRCGRAMAKRHLNSAAFIPENLCSMLGMRPA